MKVISNILYTKLKYSPRQSKSWFFVIYTYLYIKAQNNILQFCTVNSKHMYIYKKSIKVCQIVNMKHAGERSRASKV